MAGSDGNPVFKVLRLYYPPIFKTPSLAYLPSQLLQISLLSLTTEFLTGYVPSCFPQFRLLAFVPDLYSYDGSEHCSGPGHLCPPVTRSPPVFVLLTVSTVWVQNPRIPREGLCGSTPTPVP